MVYILSSNLRFFSFQEIYLINVKICFVSFLSQFDGEAGEKFRKGCAEYCRNQAFALEALKKQTRKEPKLAQFLIVSSLYLFII